MTVRRLSSAKDMADKDTLKDQTPSFRQITSLNWRMVYGGRGIAVLVCVIVMMLCINCFTWIVPPPLQLLNGKSPVFPPSYAGLLWLSVAATILFLASFLTTIFLSIATTLNPAPPGSRNYGLWVIAALLLGVGGAALHASL